jgi:phospholipase D1/2
MAEPAADFFLEPIEADGPGFRPAAKAGCEVTPLIDRVHALREMEIAVLAAKRSVAFSGWLFISDAPLQSDSVRSATGGSTWLDLLTFIAARPDSPAVVRLILSDFDPLMEPNLHRLSWRAITALAGARSSLSAAKKKNLQFFPSLHGALIRGSTLSLLGFNLKDMLDDVLKEYNDAPFADAFFKFVQTPGHWSSIEADRGAKRFTRRAKPRNVLNVASHHQKLCIVDGETAFCGGMDVTDLALNDRAHKLKRMHRHRRTFDLLWHDIHCKVRGPAVFDIERNFIERWERESQLFTSTVSELAGHLPDGATLPGFFFERPMPPSRSVPRLVGPSLVQVHRTVSVDAQPSLFALMNPTAGIFETVRQDILDSYLQAIGRATRYIYFENQYFRSRAIAQALIERRKDAPRLKIVVVLPVAPEEFKEGVRDPLTLQPIALQGEIIESLRAAFGADIGFFSLIAPITSRKKSLTHEFRSPQIYVHSKLCIVDDVFASIGSANANGRSFLLDTELNIAWLDAGAKVRDFRLDLWSELLGVPAVEIARWEPETFVAKWRAIAIANARLPPRRRSGFVIEHNNKKFAAVTGGFTLSPALEAFLAIVDLSRRPVAPELMPEEPVPERMEPTAEAPSVS